MRNYLRNLGAITRCPGAIIDQHSMRIISWPFPHIFGGPSVSTSDRWKKGPSCCLMSMRSVDSRNQQGCKRQQQHLAMTGIGGDCPGMRLGARGPHTPDALHIAEGMVLDNDVDMTMTVQQQPHHGHTLDDPKPKKHDYPITTARIEERLLRTLIYFLLNKRICNSQFDLI